MNGDAPYDTDFERRLTHAIMVAIAEASGSDTGTIDVRPAETIAALAAVLARTLALLPAGSPAALRKAAERIAAQIRRQAIAAKTGTAAFVIIWALCVTECPALKLD